MSQIFNKTFDKDKIYTLFNKIGTKQLGKFLIFNESIIKNKMDNIQELYSYLSDYYFNSKKYYLDRAKTFKDFCTILRQVCKFLTIPFTTKIIYNKSKYKIYYVVILK